MTAFYTNSDRYARIERGKNKERHLLHFIGYMAPDFLKYLEGCQTCLLHHQ